MSKKREQSVEEAEALVEEVTPTEVVVYPEYEQAARELIAQPVDPAELDPVHRVYYQALADAKLAGTLAGDAKAIAYREARKWAREHNRRMPESF